MLPLLLAILLPVWLALRAVEAVADEEETVDSSSGRLSVAAREGAAIIKEVDGDEKDRTAAVAAGASQERSSLKTIEEGDR